MMQAEDVTIATRVVPIDPTSIAEAARLIVAGQLVAVPTETVYGLAADATDSLAVARIYEAKQRPSFNPLIVHVAGLEQAREHAAFDELAEKLAARFWPGPLTLVLPLLATSTIAPLVVAGLPSVALRVPAHPAMQALLEATGKPLAAPSANASGRISPTRAEHVLASLDGRIALILDGGATSVGIESTIIGIADGRARLLRAGPLDAAALGVALERAGPGIEAPGQLLSHYAPRKPLRLNVCEAGEDEWLIGFGPVAGDATLSANGNLTEAAARLFELLHLAELEPPGSIAVAPIPDEGIGKAINDRLKRGAAPRD
jgi:L-threonylcarbamoyladenylate synthase